MLVWQFNDGGRTAAGYRGDCGDCVVRAIAIATELPYQQVYDTLKVEAQRERPRQGHRSTVRDGVLKATYKRYLESLGWAWIATMGIGTGCRVHLRADELPSGRLIVSLSRHLCAVIDGVIQDTHDPSRDGTRCVYGYWQKARQATALINPPERITTCSINNG